MFGINRAIKGAFEQVTLGDLTRGVMPVAVDRQAQRCTQRWRINV